MFDNPKKAYPFLASESRTWKETMNTSLVKTINVELDEYQLTNLAIIVNRYYRDHPNRGSRSDIKEILDVLVNALDNLKIDSI